MRDETIDSSLIPHPSSFIPLVLFGITKRPNLEATISHFIAMILQVDMPLRLFAELCPFFELAGLDALIPVVAAELIRHDFFAVEPVFDMIPFDHDAPLVPFAHRPSCILSGRIERIARGSGR